MADQAIAANFLGAAQVTGALPVLHTMVSGMAGGASVVSALPVLHTMISGMTGVTTVVSALPVLHTMVSGMAGGAAVVPALPVRHPLLGAWVGLSTVIVAFNSAARKPTTTTKKLVIPVMRILPYTVSKHFGVTSFRKRTSAPVAVKMQQPAGKKAF